MKNFKFIIIILCLLLFIKCSYALSMTLSVPDKYAEVYPGENIYFETEVKYPENDVRKDLRIEYFIYDPQNKEVAYLKVLKAIETQASFMDNLVVPGNSVAGVYRISAKIKDYDALDEEVGTSFNVKKGKVDTLTLSLFIGFGILVFIAIGIMFELYVLIRRKSL